MINAAKEASQPIEKKPDTVTQQPDAAIMRRQTKSLIGFSS